MIRKVLKRLKKKLRRRIQEVLPVSREGRPHYSRRKRIVWDAKWAWEQYYNQFEPEERAIRELFDAKTELPPGWVWYDQLKMAAMREEDANILKGLEMFFDYIEMNTRGIA